jgi:hypothetical protein
MGPDSELRYKKVGRYCPDIEPKKIRKAMIMKDYDYERWWLSFTFLAISLLVVLGITGCKTKDPFACESHVDCGGENYCYTNLCIYAKCTDDSQCPGRKCVNYMCVENGSESVPNYSISGAITGNAKSGVTITLSGNNNTIKTVSDESGAYLFSGLDKGSYIITPYAFGYSFTPQNVSVTVDEVDVIGKNFQPGVNQMCSKDHWCWENPRLQGNSLLDIWGSGPNDVWAVGTNSTILRYKP